MLPALGLAAVIVFAAGTAADAQSRGGGAAAAPIDDARVAELLGIIDDLRAEIADLRRDAGLAQPGSGIAPRTAVRSRIAPSMTDPSVAPVPVAPAPWPDPLPPPMLRTPAPAGVSATAPALPPPSRPQGTGGGSAGGGLGWTERRRGAAREFAPPTPGAIARSMPSGANGPAPEWRGAPAPGAPPGGPGAAAGIPGGGEWRRAAAPMAGGHDDSLRHEIAELRAMMRELIDLVRGMRDQLEHGRGGGAAWTVSPSGTLNAAAPAPAAATPR
jgi:hypothetical protein